MSQNSSDKTETATSGKLDKARKEGQIPRAKEFTSAVMLLGFVVYFTSNIDLFFTAVSNIFKLSLTFDHDALFQHDGSGRLLKNAANELFKLFTPIFIVLLIGAFIGAMSLGGWFIQLNAMAPKFSKLNPLSGIKRMFSSKSAIELIKSIIKTGVMFAVLYWFLTSNMQSIIGLQATDYQYASVQVLSRLQEYALYMIAILLVYGAIDLPYQNYLFGKEMKMSKTEIKEEHKQNEGRPEIKGRIRQIQREMSQRSIPKVVPTADVIIMNPTHYAVAIKYDLSRAPSPFVVAKGEDEVALHIQRVALDAKVEVIVSPALARSIYHTTQIDQMIPSQLYNAMALVLNYVLQIAAYKQGKTIKPEPMAKINIPKGLEY